jgi:hypothetical protein
MTGIAKSYAPPALPEDIVRTLRTLIRRARVVLLVRGCFAVAAVGLASVLGAMAVDAGVTFFSTWPRWVLSLSALAATLLAALGFLVLPLRRVFTLAGVARAIEARHPELQERVSSAVELLGSSDAPELRGSADLLAALAGEAVRDAKGVRPRREVTLRSVRPYLLAALGLSAVLAGAFSLWPQQARHVWARVLAPYQDLPNVLGQQLSIRPGDAVIAAGEDFEVEVEVSNKAVSSAEVHAGVPGGADEVVKMTSLPARDPGQPRFAHAFGPAAKSFRYRIRAGDALSRYYTVTVVPRPAVERFHVAYEFPAYTGRPREDRPEGEGDIRAVAGTTVEIIAATNTSVGSAELRVNGQTVAPGQVSQADGKSVATLRYQLPRKLQGRWSIDMVKAASPAGGAGEHRFTASTELRSIESVTDAPPIVKVLSPSAALLKLKPADRLPIHYAAGDDFGVTRAELLVDLDGKPQPPIALPLAGDANGPLRLVQGRTVLDLGEIAPPGTRQVAFRVRVQDNLPASLEGPQEGVSATCIINLDLAAISYVRQIMLSEELAIRDVLLAVLAHLKESKMDSAPLRKELLAQADANHAPAAGEPALSPASAGRADAITRHLSIADSAIREILPRLEGGEFLSMGQKLATLANDHIARAHDQAGQIRVTDRAAQRAGMADEADFQIDRSIALVNDLLKELDVMGEVAQRAQEVAELSKKQDELAAALEARDQQLKADAATATMPTSGPSDANSAKPFSGDPKGSASKPPTTPDQWQKDEQAVAAKLAGMVRQSTRAMQQAMTRDQEKAKNLAADARKLATQQTALAEMTRRAGEVPRIQSEIRSLATSQQALADQTAKVAPQEGAALAAAAAAMKSDQPEGALANQQATAAALAQKADTAARAAATADLAKKAEDIAARQESLAKQSADLKIASETAAAQSRTATSQAAQSANEQQAARAKLAGELAKLQQRQKDLAARSDKIEDKSPASAPTPAQPSPASAPGNPASAPAGATPGKPSEAMAAAASKLSPEKFPEAAASVKEAARQARQHSDHLSADAKAAQAKADKDRADQAKADQARAAEANAALAKSADPNAATTQVSIPRPADANIAKPFSGDPKASALAAASAKARSEEAAKIADEQAKIDADLASLAPAANQAQQAADRVKQAQAEQARQAKAAEEAGEKLSQLAKPQQEAKDQAAELAKGAPAALPAAAAALAKNDPKPAMQQAAQAMQAKTAPQAAKSADDAAKQARQLAQALRAAAGPDAPAAAQNAPKLAQLAKTQADLNRQVAEKAQQARDAADRLRAELWAGLKDQQAKVAVEAAAMSDRVRGLAPQEDRIDTKAARSTAESAQLVAAAQDANARSQAAQSTAQSAEVLTDLARRLGAEAPPASADGNAAARPNSPQATGSTRQRPQDTPGTPPLSDEAKREQLKDDAGALAARQQAIAAQAKDLADGRLMDALRPAQEQILGKTSDLADDVGLLRTFADQLIPDASARQDANHAARSIESAIAAQGQARSSLASKAAQPAEAQQRKSAAQLESAAGALDQLGRKMADLAKANPAASPDEESTDLADSLDAADQAAQSKEARDAALAAKLLAQLAKTAAQQAKAMGVAPAPDGDDPEDPQGQPSHDSKGIRGVGLLPVELLVDEYRAGRISITQWDKLPGELKNEILQGAADEGPEEYRSLIKRYFEEVARRGAAQGGDTKK